jgi:hypothetical protein
MVWTNEDQRRLWAQQRAKQRADMAAAAAERAARVARQQADTAQREKDFRRRMDGINEQNRLNHPTFPAYPVRRDPVISDLQRKRKSGAGGLLLGILFVIAVAIILDHSDTPSDRFSSRRPETTFEPTPTRTDPAYSPQRIEPAPPSETSDTPPSTSSAPPLQLDPGSAYRPADAPAASDDEQPIDSPPPYTQSPTMELAPIPLSVIHRVMPVYPSLARQVRVEGSVELSVEVLPDGSVRQSHLRSPQCSFACLFFGQSLRFVLIRATETGNSTLIGVSSCYSDCFRMSLQ